MSHSHARLNEEHRCIAKKCPGHLKDAPEKYGRYAYWRRGKGNQWGWYATPSKAQIKKYGERV